ncbi:MAG: SIMPL domain-containing protein, partial [Anaerolineae bacterium]
MNSKLIAILAVGLLAVMALGAWTQEAPAASQAPRTVTVTGEAEVRVVPDEVILTLGVETWDKDLDLAKRQNDEIAARVLALAADYGIAPEHVQTDYVSIEPRYRNGYYEERDFIGYFVHKTIVITLRDLGK